ncbi:MAG TPA: PDZ domain-containing protein, partial [Bacteroidota bacterium]|nr:PDZ domain-containing protein [Bacteroidota bacterium]
MSYFDKHPNQFRLVFGLLTGYLLILAAVTVYQIASRPTDENLFTNPQSNLYVVENIPTIGKMGKDESGGKGILVGDLVISMNRKPVSDTIDARRALAGIPDTAVECVVYRSGSQKRIPFIVQRRYLTPAYVKDIGPTAQVIVVTAGGASDRAGMKVGDLILRINGKSFKNSSEADQILAEGQVGKDLVYDVMRDGEILSLHVTIAAIGVPFPLLVSTFSGIMFFCAGIFFGLVRPRFIGARLNGLSFIAFGYFITVFLIRRGYSPASFDRIRDLTMVVTVFLAVPLTIHVSHYFPKERPDLLARKWIRRIPYVFTILGIVATVTMGNPGFFGSLIVMVLYAIVITIMYRKQASPEYKRLIRVMKNASTVAGIGSGLLGFYLFYNLGSSQDVGYVMLPLILVPLSHLYSTGRYRLMGLDLRIRRNVQYILVTSLWIAVLAALAFRILFWLQGATLPIPNIQLTATSIEVLDAPLQPDQRIWLEKGILMLLSVVVVFVCWRIARRGQNLIDTLYYRSRYDYRRAANELAEVMATKFSMVDLARGTVEKLSGLLQLKRVGVLFFRDQSACCCQEVYGFDGGEWGEFCVRNGRELTEAMQSLEGETSTESLPETIRTEFRKHGFLYVTTIRSKEKLVGALLVGEK